MRTLDDVYGPDLDRFPLEQETSPPTVPLDWSDVPMGVRAVPKPAPLPAHR